MTNYQEETKYLYHPESRDIYIDELETNKKCLQSRNIRSLLDNFHNVNDPSTIRFQKHMSICPVCQSVYEREVEFRNFISSVIPAQKVAREQRELEKKEIFELTVKHQYFSPFWSKKSWGKKLDTSAMYLGDIASIFISRKFAAGILLAGFLYTFLKLVNF